MKKIFKNSLLFLLVVMVFSLSACSINATLPWWKFLSDYPNSTWTNDENELFYIQVFVQENYSGYGIITYNGITQKFDARVRSRGATSIIFYENNPDIENQYERRSFYAAINRIEKDSLTCECWLDLKSFFIIFCGEDETTAKKGLYYFILKKVE